MDEFEYIDKSNYLRGLLILIGKDNIISENEEKYILNIGKKLGFAQTFCEDAVKNYLDNPYVNLTPPKFVSKKVAENFIGDAISLGFTDNELHVDVLDWINKIVMVNNLDHEWLDKQIIKFGNNIKNNKKLFVAE